MKIKIAFIFTILNVLFVMTGCGGRNTSGNESNEFYCTDYDTENKPLNPNREIRVAFPSCSTHPTTCEKNRTIGSDGVYYYPAILFVPGNNLWAKEGRFSMDGMKGDMNAALAKGFAVASINYRRNQGMNAIQDDIACSVRYLKQRPPKDNMAIDADRIGVLGHSLGAMGTWQLAAGIEPIDTKNILADLERPSTVIVNTDWHSDQTSQVAAVILSNGGADPLALATDGRAKFNINAGSFTVTNPPLSCGTNLSMFYVLRMDFLSCQDGRGTPLHTDVTTFSAPYWMATSSGRDTQDPSARHVLIVNAKRDTVVQPINSFIAQEHFNTPALNRPHSTSLVQLDDNHAYSNFSASFSKIAADFFEAALTGNGNPSTINYCAGVTRPAGDTNPSAPCVLNPAY